MFLLTTFNMIILVLLISYIFYRLMKTKGIFTLISFTLQLSALTIVLLCIVYEVQTNTMVEGFYLFFGVVIPCCFMVFDYLSMIKKVKEKGSFEGLITIDRNNKGKIENSVEIMSVISNDAFVSETVCELGLLKEDLFKGIKKKLIQAEASYNENNYDAAYEIYNGLIGLFGTSSNLNFNYGNISFKKGLLSEAQVHYRKVLELNELLIEKLRKSDTSNNLSETIKNIEFKEYLVYYNIGVTYLNMGKVDFALDNFEKSLEINPSFSSSKEGMGRVFAKNGRKLEAVKCYEEILEKDCNNYAICLLLGIMFTEMNSVGQAENCFEQCIKIRSDRPEAYTEFGKLLISQKKYLEAAKVFRCYTSIKEDDYYGHYNLASCYYQTKELNKAISEYERATILNPKSYNCFFNVALIYEEKQEYERAIECYKNAILMKIDFVDAYNNLGILFSKQQRQIEALTTYTNGLKVSPNNFRLYYNMGVVLFDLRRYEDAADAFIKAVEINPQDNEVYYYLGASLTELKKYDEAIVAYSKALNENISEGEIYYNIASVYALMKKQDIAIDNLKKAISTNPSIREEIYQNSVFDYMQTNLDFVKLIS
ncbi:MAG TPA: tetratricopeptide repeat protein [Ruminiclostridium sp.]